MQPSIYWYDLETTGTHSIHDRVLQFAGIRTDLALNELAETDDFFCRLTEEVIPSPEAMLITGIKMSDVSAKGLAEADFAKRILQRFSEPKTCVAGYNNLRFDDEFIRQLLYRNLLEPYEREWRQGNSRWDAIDLLRTAYALRPEGFEWPRRDHGAPSFRLEALAAANGIAHANPHDALGDVRATIGLVKRLREVQPNLYGYLFSLRDKHKVLDQLYPLGKTPLVHVASIYPARAGCMAVVLPLCQHPSNSNGIVCCDLSQPLERLLEMKADELRAWLFAKAKDRPEEGRAPLNVIQVNRCPSISPMTTLRAEDAARHGIDLDLCMSQCQKLQTTAGLVEKIQEAYKRPSAAEDQDDLGDPEEMLYTGGFFDDADRLAMDKVHKTEPDELAALAGSFRDGRLDELLFRYRARNFPDTLSPAEQAKWGAFKQRRFDSFRSPEAVLAQLVELKPSHPEALDTLEDLQQYLKAQQR